MKNHSETLQKIKSALTFSEEQALKNLCEELIASGDQSKDFHVKVTDLAKKYEGIGRSTYTTMLKKMEMAGLMMSFSRGAAGIVVRLILKELPDIVLPDEKRAKIS